VLGPTLAAFLAWPWLKPTPRIHYLLLFLQGALLLACVYCAWFAGPGYLLMALASGFLLVPLLLWTPIIFGVQLLRRAWGSALPGARWVFAAGMLPLLLAQGWAWQQYQQVAAAVQTLAPGQRQQAEPLLRVVPRTYLAERLAGQLVKYHASPEMIYDGWRPPLHDPLVNVCMVIDFLTQPHQDATAPLIIAEWKPQYGGYWETDINAQAAFYHRLFPDEPVKVDCACSHTGDAQGYFAWKPGLTNGWGTSLVEVERQRQEFDAEMARAQAKETADSIRAADKL
jgi:hypothetical protein